MWLCCSGRPSRTNEVITGERARRNGSSARFTFCNTPSSHLAVFISPSSIQLLRSRKSTLLFFSQWRRDDSEKERKKQREKSPEARLCFPLLCSRSFLRWIWEKTREASPPYTPPHSPSILSHRFIHTFVSFPRFLKVTCAHTNTHETKSQECTFNCSVGPCGAAEQSFTRRLFKDNVPVIVKSFLSCT